MDTIYLVILAAGLVLILCGAKLILCGHRGPRPTRRHAERRTTARSSERRLS